VSLAFARDEGKESGVRAAKFRIGLALGLMVAGCNVGPDYRAPRVDAPANWSEINAGAASTRPTTLPTAQPAAVAWWTTLNDPVLDSLIDRAVQSNYSLKIASSRIREARALRRIVVSDELPSVGAAGSYTRTRISKNSGIGGVLAGGAASGGASGGGFPSIAPDLWQAGFDATWEIDVFGGVRRQIEAADAEIQAAEANLQDVHVSLMAEVAANYVELRALQRQIAIAQENVTSQRDTATLIQARFRAGLTSELDPIRAGAQVASTQSQIPALEASVHRAIHRLSVLLGKAPGELLAELSKPAPIPGVPPVIPVGLPSDLLRRRPDIRRAERQLAAANARIGAATADLFPRFALNGNVGLQASKFARVGNWDSRFWSFGPSISLPLFDRGRIYANIHAQNERERQALDSYQDTVLRAFEEVENALVAYAKEQMRRQDLEEVVRANRKAVELVRQLNEKGVVAFLDVLDAQRSLFASQEQLAGSEREVASDLVALYKALGGGWETEATEPGRHEGTK
jgi:NodT family efflux transporter outer membrane factor (OMF) lipoprotein